MQASERRVVRTSHRRTFVIIGAPHPCAGYRCNQMRPVVVWGLSSVFFVLLWWVTTVSSPALLQFARSLNESVLWGNTSGVPVRDSPDLLQPSPPSGATGCQEIVRIGVAIVTAFVDARADLVHRTLASVLSQLCGPPCYGRCVQPILPVRIVSGTPSHEHLSSLLQQRLPPTIVLEQFPDHLKSVWEAWSPVKKSRFLAPASVRIFLTSTPHKFFLDTIEPDFLTGRMSTQF